MSEQEETPLEERVDDLIKETKTLASSSSSEMRPVYRIMRETLVAIRSLMAFTEAAVEELQSGSGPGFDTETAEWMKGWVDQVVTIMETTLEGMPEGAAAKEVRDLYEQVIQEGKEISAYITENTIEDDEDEDEEEK